MGHSRPSARHKGLDHATVHKDTQLERLIGREGKGSVVGAHSEICAAQRGRGGMPDDLPTGRLVNRRDRGIGRAAENADAERCPQLHGDGLFATRDIEEGDFAH